jgi:hypothetical protein
MLVRITHLKAPWPPGALVNDVVHLQGDSIPSWAAGKCEPTDAAPTLTHGTATGDGTGQALPDLVANVTPESVSDADAQAAEEAASLSAHQALIDRAKSAGIKPDGRWSDARLMQEVQKAEALKA